MKITKARMKEIILEEVKAMEESGDYHDFGGPEEMVDFLDDEGGAYDTEAEAGLDAHAAAGKLADKIYDLANDIDEYGGYDTDTQTEAYRQLLQAMQEAGVNLERMLMILHEGNTTMTKKLTRKALARIIKEETIREITSAMGGDDMGGSFKGGSIDIDPLSDEEQEASTDAYYELFDFLMDSELPGSKPSEKLKYALRWIAKFEGGKAGSSDAQGDSLRQFMRNAPGVSRSADGSRSLEEGVATHPETGEMAVTADAGDSEWPSDAEFGAARQDDLQTTMMKAVREIKDGQPQKAYETLLRALAAAGLEGADDLPPEDEFELEEYRGGSDAKESEKRKKDYRTDATAKSANKGYRSTGAN